MKYIKKEPAPAEMKEWIEKWQTNHGGAMPLFSDFTHAEKGKLKKTIKESLLKEQGFICCYCMQTIEYYDCHFEHFAPRHWHEDGEVDYSNLFLSCEGELYDQTHCGRPKDDEDIVMLVCPSNPTVEGNFQYSTEGEIFSNTAKGMTTLRILRLKSESLKRHRLEALKAIGFFDEDFDDIREEIREEHLHKTTEGAYIPFCAAVIYCIDHFP